MMISAPMAILFYCLVQCTTGEVSLESSPSYVCPAELVTLNCSVPDTDNQLVWTVPNVEDGSSLMNITIFCNNKNPIGSGLYQPDLVGCTEGRIISTLIFNVFYEVNVTCGTGINDALKESVFISPQGTPPRPVLSVNVTTLEGSENGNGYAAIIRWETPTEDISGVAGVLNLLILQFSPRVPECGQETSHNCSLARDTGPLTAGQVLVTLEVGTRYEVVARAESCGGDLSSPWSDPLIIHLQVPPHIMRCVAVPTYDSAGDMEILELNVAWSPLNSTEITPGRTTSLQGYTMNYTTDTQSIEQTVSPSSCDSQCRDTLSRDEVTSVITTVTVRAWNTFGRGEEAICNNYPINNTNNVARVVVEVTASTAEVSLQWLHQQPVYPHLIQVFCSANLTHKEMDLCGETSDGQGKVVINELNPNTRYYYKLEASGRQPFVVQGTFTTSTTVQDDNGSISTAESVGIAIGVTGIALILVIGVAYHWRKLSFRANSTTNNTPHQGTFQTIGTPHQSTYEHELAERTWTRFDMPQITGQLCEKISQKHDFVPQKGSTTDKPLGSNHSRGIAVSESKIVVTGGKTRSDGSIEFFVSVFSRQSPNDLLFKIVGPFNTPRGVALYKDEFIYVADSENNRIVKFDHDGHYLQQRGRDDTFGEIKVELLTPHGLCIKDTFLYVCASGNSGIQIFDMKLNLLRRLGGHDANPCFLSTPVGIAYCQNDNNFYVVDDKKSFIIILKICIEENCYYVSTIQISSNQQLDFYNMRGIAIYNNYILVTQKDHNFFACLTIKGELRVKKDIRSPIDLEVADDTVYVCSCSDDVDAIQKHQWSTVINNT